MTIFKDINELKNIILESEEYFDNDDEYRELLIYIDNIKASEIPDATKQQLTNLKIQRILVKTGKIKSFGITKWLEEQRDKYRELLAYVEQEAKWKKSIE